VWSKNGTGTQQKWVDKKESGIAVRSTKDIDDCPKARRCDCSKKKERRVKQSFLFAPDPRLKPDRKNPPRARREGQSDSIGGPSRKGK